MCKRNIKMILETATKGDLYISLSGIKLLRKSEKVEIVLNITPIRCKISKHIRLLNFDC